VSGFEQIACLSEFTIQFTRESIGVLGKANSRIHLNIWRGRRLGDPQKLDSNPKQNFKAAKGGEQ
jgi:hypothetical protein